MQKKNYDFDGCHQKFHLWIFSLSQLNIGDFTIKGLNLERAHVKQSLISGPYK